LPKVRHETLRTFNICTFIFSYRLAPEHVFPAAFDDCLKATKYFLQNAAKYGVDASKIGVSGK
jgi:acetyl esterase/lipase